MDARLPRFLGFLACSLLLAAPALAADPAPAPVKVVLKPVDIPIAWHKAISAGVSLRSVPSKDTPLGYDTMFTGAFGPLSVRFLHKGWAEDQIKMFWWPDRGSPVEVPRLNAGVSPSYLPFGPVAVRGLPPITLHFYFPPPTMNLDAWKGQSKTLYVLPMQCLGGEALIGGKKVLLALLDRNLNGCASDPCTLNDTEGDWLLFDKDGDGAIAVATFNGEARGLTKFVPLNGHVWSVACNGREAVLKPVTLPACKVRIAGLGKSAALHGWSCSTGSFDGALDDGGCVEIPRDKFQLWSYEWTKDDWRLSGQLRSLGTLDPPAAGARAVEVGPKLKATLAKTDEAGSVKFEYRCAGRAKETVSVFRGGKQVVPAFVVFDAQNREVFRKEQSFG